MSLVMSLDHFWFNLIVKEKKLCPSFLIIYVKTCKGHVGVRDCRQPCSSPVEFKPWICTSWTVFAASRRLERRATWSEAYCPSWWNVETNKNTVWHIGIVFFDLGRFFPFSLDKKDPYFIVLITVQASKFPVSSKSAFTVTTAWAGGACSESMDCRLAPSILLMSLFFLHSKVFSGNFFKNW